MATGGSGPGRRDGTPSEDEIEVGPHGEDAEEFHDPDGGARPRGGGPHDPPPYHPLPRNRDELDAMIRNYMDTHRHEMTMMMAAAQNRNNEMLIDQMSRSIAEGLRIGAAHMTPPPPAPAAPVNPLQHRKIPPPIFKGLQGERPDAHLLRAEDWFDAYQVRDRDKFREFKHTLDHLAREWYDTAVIPECWEECKQVFSKYFSTQGRSIKHLHERWRTFAFNPDSDDIEKFIRDVKECARQLNYDNRAILHLIKSCMPTEIYGVLYNMDDLNAVITLVKDIYAQKITHTTDPASATANSSTAPFTAIFHQMANMKDRPSTENNTLDKLTEALYKFEIRDKPRKPFKPFITPPRRRGQGRGFRSRNSGRGGNHQDRGNRSFSRNFRGGFNRRNRGGRFNNQGSNGQPNGGNSRRPDGRKFDRSPNNKKPRVASRTPDRDKDRCHRCWRFGHWRKDCPAGDDAPPEVPKGPTYDDYCRYDDSAAKTVRFASDAYADAFAAMNGALDLDSPLRGTQ